jgi:hypothetical protein
VKFFFDVISKVRPQGELMLRALSSKHELASIGTSEEIRQQETKDEPGRMDGVVASAGWDRNHSSSG